LIWDIESRRETLSIPTTADQRGAITGLALSPDGRRLAWTTYTKTQLQSFTNVHDAVTGQVLTMRGGHRSFAESLTFSPDSLRLATASDDETIIVWDTIAGREVLTFRGHTAAVNSVAFSPDGLRLASGSTDGTIRIWDVRPLD
jgi:WD40 repeat protein